MILRQAECCFVFVAVRLRIVVGEVAERFGAPQSIEQPATIKDE
jgi:hypothetical protein